MMLKVFSSVAFGFSLEPEGAGATLVRMDYRYVPRSFFAALMFRLLMGRKLERMRQTLLRNLKALVEGREAAAGPRVVPRPAEKLV